MSYSRNLAASIGGRSDGDLRMTLEPSGAAAQAADDRRASGYAPTGRAERLAQLCRLATLAALAAMPLVWLVDVIVILQQGSMRVPGASTASLALTDIAFAGRAVLAVLHSADLLATVGVLWVLQILCSRFRTGFVPLAEIGQDMRSLGSWFGLAAVIQALLAIGLPLLHGNLAGIPVAVPAFEFNLTAIGSGAVFILLGILLEQSAEEA